MSDQDEDLVESYNTSVGGTPGHPFSGRYDIYQTGSGFEVRIQFADPEAGNPGYTRSTTDRSSAEDFARIDASAHGLKLYPQVYAVDFDDEQPVSTKRPEPVSPVPSADDRVAQQIDPPEQTDAPPPPEPADRANALPTPEPEDFEAPPPGPEDRVIADPAPPDEDQDYPEEPREIKTASDVKDALDFQIHNADRAADILDRNLRDWVREDPSFSRSYFATEGRLWLGFAKGAMEVAKMMTDPLNLGKGTAEGGWRGYGQDLLRVAAILPVTKGARAAARASEGALTKFTTFLTGKGTGAITKFISRLKRLVSRSRGEKPPGGNLRIPPKTPPLPKVPMPSGVGTLQGRTVVYTSIRPKLGAAVNRELLRIRRDLPLIKRMVYDGSGKPVRVLFENMRTLKAAGTDMSPYDAVKRWEKTLAQYFKIESSEDVTSLLTENEGIPNKSVLWKLTPL